MQITHLCVTPFTLISRLKFLEHINNISMILFQCLVIIVIVLARAGWRGSPVAHVLDPLWLTSITTGGYILILGALLTSYLLGEQIAYKLVKTELKYLGIVNK